MIPLLKGRTFAVLDVETTGLDPWDGDRVCEVGILRVRNGRRSSAFETLIDPRREVSPGAYAVNGISPEMLQGQPLFHEVAPRILEMLSDAVIICHNARFDLNFLASELQGLDIPAPSNLIIDTLHLSRRCFRFPSNSLGAVAESLGIGVDVEHRAMGDVQTTWKVFKKFAEDLHGRGVRTLEEIIEIQRAPFRRPSGRRPVLPPLLEEAVRAKKPLRMVYLSAYGEKTERTVVPVQIVEEGSWLYLVARCMLRNGEERSFRLDRILSLDALP